MTEKLNNILQTLKLINTRGDDTIIMSQCLIAMQQLIKEQSKQEEGK